MQSTTAANTSENDDVEEVGHSNYKSFDNRYVLIFNWEDARDSYVRAIIHIHLYDNFVVREQSIVNYKEVYHL